MDCPSENDSLSLPFAPFIPSPGQDAEGVQLAALRVHHLKIWISFYESVATGSKSLVVPREEGHFRVGDFVLLWPFDPDKGRYVAQTGRLRKINALCEGGRMGIEAGCVALGLVQLSEAEIENIPQACWVMIEAYEDKIHS